MNQLQHVNNNISNSISEDAIDYVNQLFEVFEIHINAFNLFAHNTAKLEIAKHEWVLCFQNAKLEKIQLTRGINKIRTLKFKYMISPSDFIELCQPSPEDIGAPSMQEAFQEACQHSNPATWSSSWSHVAVKEAYKRSGHSQFLNGKHDKTYNVFTQHYLNACNDYAAGRIMDQIPHKKPFSSSEIDRPYIFGKYEMVKSGIMKIYENVRTHEECLAICEKLLGQGTGRLINLIKNLESKYEREGLI